MIRHITSLENYNKIKEQGIIKPSARVRESSTSKREHGAVSFEIFENNNIFVEWIKEEKQHSKGWGSGPLIGIFIKIEELKNNGFRVHITDLSTETSRRESLYTTKHENMTRALHNDTVEDYNQIGEYVHVEGGIPIKYIKKVSCYD